MTPDSFSDGGLYRDPDAAVEHALRMAEEGADIIDVGGESTRPSGVYGETVRVSAQEEMDRVVPVIERIVQRSGIPVSIDTTKSAVAEAALAAGAVMVNDISGLTFDPEIAAVTARHNAALVVMHIQGTPETMQIAPRYTDVVAEVRDALVLSAAQASAAGVRTIIVDPGIGFGKTTEHNLSLMKHLGECSALGYPLLVGPSRKGFIGAVLGLPVDQRLEGTAAACAAAILNGANILRVHDVHAMKRVASLTDAIHRAH